MTQTHRVESAIVDPVILLFSSLMNFKKEEKKCKEYGHVYYMDILKYFTIIIRCSQTVHK